MRATQVEGEERWTFYATEEESTCSIPLWKERQRTTFTGAQHKPSRDQQEERPLESDGCEGRSGDAEEDDDGDSADPLSDDEDEDDDEIEEVEDEEEEDDEEDEAAAAAAEEEEEVGPRHPEPCRFRDGCAFRATCSFFHGRTASSQLGTAHLCRCDLIECELAHPHRSREGRDLDENVLRELRRYPGGRLGRVAKNICKAACKATARHYATGAVHECLERLVERGQVERLRDDRRGRARWSLAGYDRAAYASHKAAAQRHARREPAPHRPSQRVAQSAATCAQHHLLASQPPASQPPAGYFVAKATVRFRSKKAKHQKYACTCGVAFSKAKQLRKHLTTQRLLGRVGHVHVFGGLKQDTMWPIGGDTASEAASHRLPTAHQFNWTTKVEPDRGEMPAGAYGMSQMPPAAAYQPALYQPAPGLLHQSWPPTTMQGWPLSQQIWPLWPHQPWPHQQWPHQQWPHQPWPPQPWPPQPWPQMTQPAVRDLCARGPTPVAAASAGAGGSASLPTKARSLSRSAPCSSGTADRSDASLLRDEASVTVSVTADAAKRQRKRELSEAAAIAAQPIASGFGHRLLVQMGWGGTGTPLQEGGIASPIAAVGYGGGGGGTATLAAAGGGGKHRGLGLGAEGEDGGNRWAAPPDESRNETPSMGAMMGAQAVDQRQEGRRRALLLGKKAKHQKHACTCGVAFSKAKQLRKHLTTQRLLGRVGHVHVFGGLKQDTMWPIGGDTASEANSHRLSTARQFIWTTKVESDRSSGTAAERQQKRELSEEEELDDTRWHRGMGLGAEGEDGSNRNGRRRLMRAALRLRAWAP